MERIALFGGMFDPVHNGHLYAAQCAIEALSLDRVIFIPARVPPHKAGCHVAGEHRAKMLRLAIDGEARYAMSEYELLQQGISYSYRTAEHFAAVYPAAKLYFLIGDEAYNLLHTWKYPERIRQVAEFAVVTRENTPPPEDAVYVHVPAVDISSTTVRRFLADRKAIDQLVPKKVAAYIENHRLYQ